MPRVFPAITPMQREFARRLRAEQTDCERLLWQRLRNRQLAGLKFRRQYAMPPYVLDFYCYEKCLGVELDGSQHLTETGLLRDQDRGRYLAGQGVRVLRFDNLQVIQRMDEVLEEILRWASA